MATAQDWAFEVGDRVRSVGGGEDDECGKVLAVAGDELSGGVIADGCVLVAWDQGIRTVIEVSALEYEDAQAFAEAARAEVV